MDKKGIKVNKKVFPGVISSCQVHGGTKKKSNRPTGGPREDKVEVNLNTLETLDLKKLSAFFVGPTSPANREATLKLGMKLLKFVMEAHKKGLFISFTRNNNIHKTLGFIKGSIFTEEGV
jgi:hypothetical protein